MVLLACGVYATGTRLYASLQADKATLAASDRALRFAPGNAAYWQQRAELLDEAGRSGTAALERAVKLNPGDSSIWIQLGLDAEARQDFVRAEECLLQAATVSRLFQPRWTLANYYFRRNSARSWGWTRQALELAPRDASAAFALCWRMSQDPNEILQKAIPESQSVTRQYAAYLMRAERLSAAETVVQRLWHNPTPADTGVLLEFCDRCLARQMAGPALTAWNAMCRFRILPFASLRPEGGQCLTNGDFARGSIGTGFNWRIDPSAGVSVTVGSGLAEVYFSGKEPEQIEPLWEWMPILPGQRYEVRFEYQTSGVPPQSGLHWQVSIAAHQHLALAAASIDLSSSSWTEAAIRFDAPEGTRLARLGLAYSRVPGRSRVQGSVLTRAMRLTAVP